MNQTIISTDRERAIYSKYEKQYKDSKYISPSFVRVEKKIQNGVQTYDFGVTKDANSDSVTERKIDRKDLFVISHMGLFLMARLTTNVGIEVLQTYPNIYVFPDETTNFYGAHLEVFYNGLLSVKVGQTTFIEAMDTRQFRSVEDIQQSSASTKSSAKSGSGLVELTPQIILDGNQKNEIQVKAPVSAAAKVANTNANTDNYLVFFARGFLLTQK